LYRASSLKVITVGTTIIAKRTDAVKMVLPDCKSNRSPIHTLKKAIFTGVCGHNLPPERFFDLRNLE